MIFCYKVGPTNNNKENVKVPNLNTSTLNWCIEQLSNSKVLLSFPIVSNDEVVSMY